VTTANQVTIFRILLIPIFVVELLYYVRTGQEAHRFAAVICFGLAAALDAVDGYIARRYHQWSELGTFLDPLADKLLLVSAVVFLSFVHAPHLDSLPLWLTGTIIGRDAVLLLGLVVIHLTVGKVTVRPHFTGKIATVLQMGAVICLLMKWCAAPFAPWAVALMLGAAIFTAGSGVIYLWAGIHQLSTSPHSEGKPHPER
jgi:CDP-diacylglycerol--glycerol-3-phosphate 3-phosphatidyltransferase